MKKIVISFVLASLFLNLYSQEYNFNADSYKFTRAADHENDPRLFYYDVGFYFLDISLDNTSTYISGNVRIDLDLLPEYNNELVFDLTSNMSVDSVKVNGNLCTYSQVDDQLVIDYTHVDDFSANYMVSSQIFYHGSPSDGVTHSSYPYGTGYFEFVYTLSEPYYAKHWFPCKQVLSDKADSSYCYITIPVDLLAGSNGLMVNETLLGGGKKRMEWQSSYPIDFYLISVSVANYRDYSFVAEIPQYSANVLIQNYLPDNNAYFDQIKPNLDRTEPMMVALSERLGLYPHNLEKYGHCIVPLGGGMEHQTMTTIGVVNFNVVVHELAHSWFGNYITCSSWQDIWINEGFASYCEYIGIDMIQPAGSAEAWLTECQNLAKQATVGSVYVPFEELYSESRVFDYKLSYKKGACLVHMLRYIINDDDLFFASLREYLSIYGNSTANAEDFKAVMETETGIDLDSFFDEWYYGEGYPTYTVLWWQNEGNVNIELTQTTSAPATTLFTIPMEFEIVYEDETGFITRQIVDANYCTYQIPVSGNVVDIIVNPTTAILADMSVIQSIDELKIPELMKAFPNPAIGSFNIVTEIRGDFTIQILNSDAKIVQQSNFCGNNFWVDVNNLSEGVYTIKLSGMGKTTFEKIVVLK